MHSDAAQKYAGHVHKFKEDTAGLSEVSIGYIVAGDLAASPKSPAYSLLKKGALEERDIKKLKKCPKVPDCAARCKGTGYMTLLGCACVHTRLHG